MALDHSCIRQPHGLLGLVIRFRGRNQRSGSFVHEGGLPLAIGVVRLTGEGWFRSKDGKSFEGFKLEELRRWTWLLLSPLFLIGVVVWWILQSQGAFSISALFAIYRDLLVRNCSNVWAQKYWFDDSCNIQMVFIAPWIASIGYSAAPILRKHGSLVLHGSRNTCEASGSLGKSPGKLDKKANL